MDTYVGHVRTPADAIKLFEACRLGLLPRVQRRLSEKERQSIRSGSVFVWDEREAGMRRWTDGKSWSASRVSGSFLTYREMEGKRGGGNFMPPAPRRMNGKTPDSGRGSDEDVDMDGEGPDGYRYKPDGLMKQSFSITTSTGQHLHLISYYSRPHANQQELMQPTQDPALKHIVPVKGMYPESTVHEQTQGPVTTRTPMQNSPYIQSPGLGHRQQYTYHQVHQTYGAWPPSPVATPPHNYPVGMYSQHQHALPPPSGPAHSSPHQYMQHGLPQTTNPPQQTSYDRPPPPLQDSQQRIAGSTPQHQMLMPAYAPNPSHRVAQAKLIAEQQAQQAQRLTQQMPIDPRITGNQHPQHPYGQPAPNGQSQNSQQIYRHEYAQPSPPQSNGHSQPSPPQCNGNSHGSPHLHGSAQSPQLNGHPSPCQSGGHVQSPASTHTPPQAHSRPQSQPPTPLALTPSGGPPPLKNDVSTGNSIPSISSLVNHSEDPSVVKDTRSIDGGSSRSGSRSPKDNNRGSNIQTENLSGFGEDARALGVLNRKLWI